MDTKETAQRGGLSRSSVKLKASQANTQKALVAKAAKRPAPAPVVPRVLVPAQERSDAKPLTFCKASREILKRQHPNGAALRRC